MWGTIVLNVKQSLQWNQIWRSTLETFIVMSSHLLSKSFFWVQIKAQGQGWIKFKEFVIVEDWKMEFPCQYCDKVFPKQRTRKYHYAVDHLKIRYICSMCEFEATAKTSLKDHIQAIHLKIKVKCSHCSATLTSETGLKKHLRAAHNVYEKKPRPRF